MRGEAKGQLGRRQILDRSGSLDNRAMHIELGARDLDAVFLQAQEQKDIRAQGSDRASIEFERLDRELSFVARPREVIREQRPQVLSLEVDIAPAIGELHR